MLLIPIEKEIEKEQKFSHKYNVTYRQVICLGIIVIIAAIAYAITKNVISTVLIAAIPAIILVIIGWYNKNGLKAEDILLKRMAEKNFQNNKRIYRTKNRFFPLYTHAYASQKLQATQRTTKKGVKNEKK